MTRWWQSALLACALFTSSASLEAQQAERVAWSPEWRSFQWWNYAGTAAVLGAAIGIGIGTDFQSDGHYGGVLFDEPFRDAFMLRSRRGRDAAKAIGDRLYHGSLIYPHLVDALLVAGVAHGQWEVAAQIFLINAEAQSLAALVSLATEHFIGRARPSTAACEADPEFERFCDGSDEYGSFISGHTAMAMTAAGLTCAHHQKLPLYGGGAPDVVACGVGITLASTTGVLRMINDRHWATDVIAGAAVGTLAGYVVPLALHYGFGDGPLAGKLDTEVGGLHLRQLVLPHASREELGLTWLGAF
jgi:membrane-associated phospholipid phosphatase